MESSSALSRLDKILDTAFSIGKETENAGPLLLRVMEIAEHSKNLITFYGLVSKAEEEARSIRNRRKLDRHLKKIDELNNFFVSYPLWSTQWKIYADHIKKSGLLSATNALEEFYNDQNPSVFLEKDFLQDLYEELHLLQKKIYTSDLSRDLKDLLTKQIGKVLRTISNYFIDGTEGLEKTAKSVIGDLAMNEHKLTVEDKRDPIYKLVKAWAINIAWSITNPIVIASFVPDVHNYWVPTIEQVVANVHAIEETITDEATIEEICEKASYIITQQSQKLIEGQDPKLLNPAKEDSESDIDDIGDSGE